MKSPELDLIHEKSKDPRVMEVFNALRANPKNTLMETFFDVAVFAVENCDLREMLTEAKKQIGELELKLAALSGDKAHDILKAVINEHGRKSRIVELEGRIKETYPALTITEATNGWAMMASHLRDAVAQLADANNANAELAAQLAAAQRGIFTAQDLPYVMNNTDSSFQFRGTDPRIKFLAEELAKLPGLTLEMAVDRWAMFSLGVAELRLEIERYKEDSKKKRFAANVNAETALDLHGAKVVRHRKDSKRGKEGVAGKKVKTNSVKEEVFNWCDANRGGPIFRNLFAKDIGELLVKEEVMKARKAEMLARFVKNWEREKNFHRG